MSLRIEGSIEGTGGFEGKKTWHVTPEVPEGGAEQLIHDFDAQTNLYNQLFELKDKRSQALRNPLRWGQLKELSRRITAVEEQVDEARKKLPF